MTDWITERHLDTTERTTVGLCIVCGFLAVIILLVDLSIPLGVAAGVPYIAVVLLSLRSPQGGFTILVAIMCSILTVIGFFASPMGGEMWKILFNRGLALFAIWVTAILALMQRSKTRELIEEKLKILQIAKELEVQQEKLDTLQLAKKLEIEEERLKVLKATMRTVQDIVGNFLNKLQLFKMEAEEKNALQPESLELMSSLIHDTFTRIQKLGNLETVPEKKMVGENMGIDYEQSTNGRSTQPDAPTGQ